MYFALTTLLRYREPAVGRIALFNSSVIISM